MPAALIEIPKGYADWLVGPEDSHPHCPAACGTGGEPRAGAALLADRARYFGTTD